MTAADAKKHSYPVPSTPKHTVKGNATTIDLGAPNPSPSPSKGLKQPSNLPGIKATGLRPPTAGKAGKPSPRA